MLVQRLGTVFGARGVGVWRFQCERQLEAVLETGPEATEPRSPEDRIGHPCWPIVPTSQAGLSYRPKLAMVIQPKITEKLQMISIKFQFPRWFFFKKNSIFFLNFFWIFLKSFEKSWGSKVSKRLHMNCGFQKAKRHLSPGPAAHVDQPCGW